MVVCGLRLVSWLITLLMNWLCPSYLEILAPPLVTAAESLLGVIVVVVELLFDRLISLGLCVNL